MKLIDLKIGDKFLIKGLSGTFEFIRKDTKGIKVKNLLTGLFSFYPYCLTVFPIV